MDINTVSIIQDLRVIYKILLYDEHESHEDINASFEMTACITDYLVSNAAIIKKGLDALKQLPLEERKKLCETYNLFYSIALEKSRWYEGSLSTINDAIERQSFDPQNKSRVVIYDKVQIEDMIRVLAYVKYVVNTSEHSLSKPLEMSPIVRHLPAKVIERYQDQLELYPETRLMKKPKLYVSKTTKAGTEMYQLLIAGGTDPGAEVLRDFVSVAGRHGLPPQAGCFDVVALNTQGHTQSFIGGMYVQLSKYSAVSEDLIKLGYTIKRAKSPV